MSGYLLHARAVGGLHYVELHAQRDELLTQRQRNDMEDAMRRLLRASLSAGPDEAALELAAIEVGIAELPWVDDDYEAGGDPGGKLLLPERKGARTS